MTEEEFIALGLKAEAVCGRDPDAFYRYFDCELPTEKRYDSLGLCRVPPYRHMARIAIQAITEVWPEPRD